MLRPPRVLIDTGHLVNMAMLLHGEQLPATLRTGWVDAYGRLLEALRTGTAVALFCEPLAYEWIQGNSEYRQRQIAAVLDEAIGIVVVATDHVLLRLEATAEATRVAPALGFPLLSPIRPLGPDPELARWKRSMYPEDAERLDRVPLHSTSTGKVTVRGIVAAIAGVVQEGATAWADAIDGHCEAVRQTRETQARYGRPGLPPERWKLHWLKTALGLHRTIELHAPGSDADAIIGEMDITRCPAVSLKTDLMWQYARRPNDPEENDLIDLATVAPMAYADLTLTEKRLAELVNQTRYPLIARRVFRDPCAFVDALDRWS